MAIKFKRVHAGCYETADGTYRIERDIGSIDEFDEPDDPEWYIYALPVKDGYGPPDSVADRSTLRECKAAVIEWGDR